MLNIFQLLIFNSSSFITSLILYNYSNFTRKNILKPLTIRHLQFYQKYYFDFFTSKLSFKNLHFLAYFFVAYICK